MTKLATRIAIIVVLAASAFPLSAEAQRGRGHGGGGFHAGGRAAVHAPARFHAPSARFRSHAIQRRAHSGAAFRRSRHAFRTRHAVSSRQARVQHTSVQRQWAVQRARQGRFASAFAARHGSRWRNGQRWWWPSRAWRYGAFAAFVPWYGPLFWPYAYADVFYFAFWPYGYYPGYWAYAYDGFFDGVFWGEAYPPVAYAYAGRSRYSRRSGPRYAQATAQELCRQPGSGITAWPIAEIDRKVRLTGEQRQLLDDVRAAGQKAANAFKNSCPAENTYALTPPGRLRDMTARLQAIEDAVTAVRPALDKFYASLSDNQKEALNRIGPRQARQRPAQAQASADEANSCKQLKPGLVNLPIERISGAVNPTGDQAAALKRLQEATSQAVSILESACPNETPLTPPGRMQAMEQRLKAMIDAANTVKAPLDDFYTSLNDEQKARFNRLGRQLAQAGD